MFFSFGIVYFFFFFFKQKTAYEMRISDWSSDVCSSDLPAQCRLRILLRGQHLDEERAGLRVLAQRLVDVLQVARDRAQGFGMDIEVVLLSDLEDAQHLHRVRRESLRPRHGKAIALEAEALDLAPPPQGRQTKARAPVVIGLDDRAEEAGEIPAFLGNQELTLHATALRQPKNG